MTIDLEGESTGKMIGMVVYSADIDAGFEYGELDPLHRPGIFKDGVLWHTIPNNHRRDRGDLYEYKLIGSLRNFKEMEFKDIGDYAFPAGDTWEPRSRDYFRMNATGLHYCTFHPYDCKAIKKKSITVPPEE
jgi:hypothetical protein